MKAVRKQKEKVFFYFVAVAAAFAFAIALPHLVVRASVSPFVSACTLRVSLSPACPPACIYARRVVIYKKINSMTGSAAVWLNEPRCNCKCAPKRPGLSLSFSPNISQLTIALCTSLVHLVMGLRSPLQLFFIYSQQHHDNIISILNFSYVNTSTFPWYSS